jgi:hypothetical protein
MRDQYRRNATAEMRRERARVEGELDAIEARVARADSDCKTCEFINGNIQRKAELQTAMLNYIS